MAQPEPFRVWTNVEGRTLEAKLVRIADEEIHMRNRGGKLVRFEVEELSGQDFNYLMHHSRVSSLVSDSMKHWGHEKSVVWPRTFQSSLKSPVRLVRRGVGDTRVYRTEWFQFSVDAQLSDGLVEEFARTLNSVVGGIEALPLGLEPRPAEGEYFEVHLYASLDKYYAAGGPFGSSGVYLSREKSVLIPLSSLGASKGESQIYEVHSTEDNHVLVHELTHQVMGKWLPKLPVWYIEGAAEYMAATPYVDGQFFFNTPQISILSYVKKYKGVNGHQFSMIPVEELMNYSYEAWLAAIADQTALKNYASVGLLVWFFYHADGGGEGEPMIAFLRDVKKGVPWQTAQKRHLIRGRSYREIEEEVRSAWLPQGLKINFR